MLVAWVAFPLLLAGLSLGCGRLLEAASGARMPGPLVLPAGLTVLIVAAQFATLTDATAELAAPLVAGLAVLGLVLRPPWRTRPGPWTIGVAVAVFLVFAAPVLLSGQATFAGYIKLDDTATYFAITDRVMEHGRSLAGLAPSSYLRTLETTIAYGYPTGSLMPLGVGHRLLSYDIAWLFQPYLAFLAAMLGLSLFSLLGRLIVSLPLRALAALIAAQPAILYGYSLWGGVKELAGAWLIASIAALVPWTLAKDRGPRAVLPLGAAAAALVCVLSLPGAVWLAPAVAGGLILGWIRLSRALLKRGVALAVTAAALAVPALIAYQTWRHHLGGFRTKRELGNLFRPLSGWQLFGIWPIGDFRLRPNSHRLDEIYFLTGLMLGAGALGVWRALQRRSWGLLIYLAMAGIGCGVIVRKGSPWLDAKALATASPALLAVALAGCGAAFSQRRKIEATVVVAVIAAGVVWSNALAYHDVWLAPRGQLHELETIGSRYAGEGPTLMTAYEPYGVRHFLRPEDPEGVSELRFRQIFLTDNTLLPKGGSTDIDRIRLDGLLVYRTLVLRRGPAASRPPSVYHLVWSGRYYEVWQRPASPARTIVSHLPLGNENQAAAVPRCSEVLRLAKLAPTLASATRPEAIPLTYPPASGAIAVRVTVPAGVYTAWLGGDWYGLASVSVDGLELGSKREELNWPGLYTDLGRARLSAGAHVVTLSYRTGGWQPGSGYGTPYAFGPLVLSREDSREPVITVPAAQARSLCGKRLDWIEALR